MDAEALNGSTALSPGTAPAVNRQLVQLLTAALDDAKVGKILAGGVVAVVGPSSAMAFSSMGNFPFEIIGGAELLKADVLVKMRQPRPGGLLRAGALPTA